MVKRLPLVALLLATLLLVGCARAATPELATPAAPLTTEEAPAPTSTTSATTDDGASLTGTAQGERGFNYESVPPSYELTLVAADGARHRLSIPVDAAISLPSGATLPSAEAIRECMTLAVTGSMEGERVVAEAIRVVEAERLPVDRVVARTTRDALDLAPNPDSPESLEQLALDTSVSVRGQCGEWLQVTTTEGENGWVRAADVTPIAEALPIIPHFPGSAPGGDPGMSLTPVTVTARVVEATGYRIEIDEANPHSAISLSDTTPIVAPDGSPATLGDIRPGAHLEVTGYDFGPADDEILAERVVILSLPD